jgi:epoxyqueuosine reductase QueG
LIELKKIGVEVQSYSKRDIKEVLFFAGLSYGTRRNSLAFDETGSRFVINAIILPVENIKDTPKRTDYKTPNELCADCDKCLKACPTNAITKDKLEPEKCIRYFQNHGIYPDETITKAAGNRLLGCDICQRVCPHNNQTFVEVPDDLMKLINIKNFKENEMFDERLISEYLGKNFQKKINFNKLANQIIKDNKL